MILIDYSQIAISNIAVQLAMSKDKMTLSIPIVRHMILNSIKGYVHKFKHEYPGDIVIAVDGESPQVFIEKRDNWILSTQKKIKLYGEYYDKIS